MDGARLALSVLAACALDLLFGDLAWLTHPVRIIGAAAGRLTQELSKRVRNQRLAGALMTASVVLGTYVAAWFALWLLRQASDGAALLANVLLIYTAVSVRDLSREARAVEKRLLRNDLPGARTRVARIVGRDTGALDRAGVVRAAVESVAESTVDGIISPLFYAFIGGAPLALAFKAVSTLDSMYGYRDEERREFGWAAARLDDVANFLPARIALGAAPLAALICCRRPARSLLTAWRDGRKHPSPNAGISEAAFAGGLGIALGGSSTYGGVRSDRPILGEALREIRIEDIVVSCRLSLVAALAFAAAGIAVLMALSA